MYCVGCQVSSPPSSPPRFVIHQANFENSSLSSDPDTIESLQPLRKARVRVSLLIGVAKLLVASFVLSLVRSGHLIYVALSQPGIVKSSSSSCCHLGWALCSCLTSSGWGSPQRFGLRRDSSDYLAQHLPGAGTSPVEYRPGAPGFLLCCDCKRSLEPESTRFTLHWDPGCSYVAPYGFLATFVPRYIVAILHRPENFVARLELEV